MGLGCVVETDSVEVRFGDLLGAGDDGVDGRAADQVGQAADHAAGAVVQVLGDADQAVRGVVAQAQGLLEGGDQGLPLLPLGGGGVAEGCGGDGGEPAGDLPAAGAGEQSDPFDVDAGVDERGGQPLGEVLQLVGDLGAGSGGQVEVVQLVDR